MYSVRFDGVTKQYPDSEHLALDRLDLTIDGEEFVSIVGPSGCGKSTALRILAGLELPSSGHVHLDDTDITEFETRDRQVGLVTQQNQLVYHLSAGRNIRFPLEVRASSTGRFGRNRPAQRNTQLMEARVADEAAQFGISHLLDRRPNTLSEGQRRLVQLVRAVVASPSLLLMDEPLGFLEDQVRLKLRAEILRVHRERRLTSIMATASQQDAMALSDRLVVMIDGRVRQIGTPDEIYEQPADTSVARFLGEPPINLFPAVVRIDRGDRYLDLPWRTMRAWPTVLDSLAGLPVVVGVRPEDIELGVPQDEGVAATVQTTEMLGHISAATLRADTGDAIRCTVRGLAPRVGTLVDVGFRPDRAHLFDAVTGAALHHPAP